MTLQSSAEKEFAPLLEIYFSSFTSALSIIAIKHQIENEGGGKYFFF